MKEVIFLQIEFLIQEDCMKQFLARLTIQTILKNLFPKIKIEF